jgi:hypothetical protein
VSVVAIALIVLAAAGVGFLLTTFLFAFSSGQFRMVAIVNGAALAVAALGLSVAAFAWRFGSASAALKWTAIATAIGWAVVIAVEFVLSFSLGA